MLVGRSLDAAVAGTSKRISLHATGLNTFGASKDPAMVTMLVFGYGALRRFGADSVESYPDYGTAESLFSDDAALLSASEWFLRADFAAKSVAEPRVQARLDRVKRALTSGLLPDVRDIRSAGLDADPPRPYVEVETPYGWVPMRALGLGYRSMIAWVVDLASRMFDAYPASPNPLAESAVALIDEIDLHLHPRWQREITGHLDALFPNVQFIATAHSPLIVQGAGVTSSGFPRRAPSSSSACSSASKPWCSSTTQPKPNARSSCASTGSSRGFRPGRA